MADVLFMMYDMHCGGVEKALFELLKVLCRKTDWNIDLLLINQEGLFLNQVPRNVHIKKCELPLDVYLGITATTKEALAACLAEGKIGTAARVALRRAATLGADQQQILQCYYAKWKEQLEEYPKEYDLAIDFQGMGVFTTFYISQKVRAKRKLSWIHNDPTVFPGDMAWQKRLYAGFDGVYCVSAQVMQKTVEKLPFLQGKLEVLYNILPREEILKKSHEQKMQLQGEMKIMTVGRLSNQKGYDIALQAMYALQKAGAEFCYYIVGDGEEKTQLQQQAKTLGLDDRVVFLGQQENPYGYLRQCDIYLQPSRFEGFCLTLGEAKLLKKPIITTDFAGAREQITHNETGIIICCDQEEMTEALRRMINSPSLRQRLTDNLQTATSVSDKDWEKLLHWVQ